ncbi:helix-turn-helix domain-containing protein [Microbacterium sp. RD1]|uniref:helix-turn-helix domain-containing protein n=1 Tax=Microbacterium sp. RD1 TaxID=3457313 RepID=UPI003FA546A1
MTNRELADYLRRARAAVDPARAGLPHDDRVRRVPGLRREEVALLAGVSTDYYTRLEQGRAIVPSDSVLDAIARALDLGPTGRLHLGHLVGAPSLPRRRGTPTVQKVRPGLWQLLETLDGAPALILGRRSDVLASNALSRALFTDWEAMRPRERNYARWMLLSDQARNLFVDWEDQARVAVESLRLDAGDHPDDELTQQLVADLAQRSAEFRQWWTQHRVHQRTHGTKRLQHPVAGPLTVDFETLTLPGDADQTLFVYTTPAGSSSRQALELLASWISTPTEGVNRPS